MLTKLTPNRTKHPQVTEGRPAFILVFLPAASSRRGLRRRLEKFDVGQRAHAIDGETHEGGVALLQGLEQFRRAADFEHQPLVRQEPRRGQEGDVDDRAVAQRTFEIFARRGQGGRGLLFVVAAERRVSSAQGNALAVLHISSPQPRSGERV